MEFSFHILDIGMFTSRNCSVKNCTKRYSRSSNLTLSLVLLGVGLKEEVMEEKLLTIRGILSAERSDINAPAALSAGPVSGMMSRRDL